MEIRDCLNEVYLILGHRHSVELYFRFLKSSLHLIVDWVNPWIDVVQDDKVIWPELHLHIRVLFLQNTSFELAVSIKILRNSDEISESIYLLFLKGNLSLVNSSISSIFELRFITQGGLSSLSRLVWWVILCKPFLLRGYYFEHDLPTHRASKTFPSPRRSHNIVAVSHNALLIT